MSKIIFFAHDPGGANAISPLIEPLSRDHEVFVFAKGPALLKIPTSSELAENTLKKIMPDFLITGTSANDKTEKILWQEAKTLGIKSMAILDHWVNYGIRFSKYGLNEIEKYNQNNTPDILPDYISVMDEFAKNEMIKENIPAEKIFTLGNPHFNNILNNVQNIENVREKFAQDDEFLVTFASEPYIEDYGKGCEKLVLQDLIEFAQNKKIKIVVKLHPKEDISKYREFENKVILDKQTAPQNLILASDLIVSMTSMFLIEALILGRQILSYQPNEKNPDKFILTRNNTVDFITKKQDFFDYLEDIVVNKKGFKYNWKVSFDGIENNLGFISGILCQ